MSKKSNSRFLDEARIVPRDIKEFCSLYRKATEKQAEKIRLTHLTNWLTANQRHEALFAQVWKELGSDFYLVFCRLIGHCLLPGRIHKDRSSFSEHLRDFTSHPLIGDFLDEMQENKTTLNPSAGRTCIRYLTYLCPELVENDQFTRDVLFSFSNLPNFDTREVALALAYDFAHKCGVDFIGDHLKVLRFLRKDDSIVFKVGQFLAVKALDYDKGGEEDEASLWIVRQDMDGFYFHTYSPKAFPILTKEIKELRRLVKYYVGPELSGTCDFPRNLDFCRSIGLIIDEKNAILRQSFA